MENNLKAIGKSKSSYLKPGTNQAEKFWSKANIQKLKLKKRGLYVEKKSARFSVTGLPGQDEREFSPQTSSIRNPRPARSSTQQFVNVRQPQNTTGTQFSHENIEVPKPPKPKKRHPKSTKYNKMFNAVEDAIDTAVQKQNRSEKKKFLSKFLNEHREEQRKNSIVIIQPKKDILRTQSSNSQWSWAGINLQDSQNMGSSKRLITATEQNKEQNPNRSKFQLGKFNFEPTTTEVVKHKQNNEEKDLYNLFVDLLQTTFSDDKIKETGALNQDTDESNVKLEIDEHVAEKLMIRTKSDNTFNPGSAEERKTSESDRYSNDVYYERQPLYRNTDTVRITPSRRKPIKKARIIEDLNFMSPRRIARPEKERMFNVFKKELQKRKTDSFNDPDFEMPRRRGKKEKLINIFKRELEKENDYVYEEPQTLFEALKVIAERKRKNLRFNIPATNKKPKRRNKELYEYNYEDVPDYSFHDLPKSSGSNSKSSAPTSKKYGQDSYFMDVIDASEWSSSESIESLQVFPLDDDNVDTKSESQSGRRLIQSRDAKSASDRNSSSWESADLY